MVKWSLHILQDKGAQKKIKGTIGTLTAESMICYGVSYSEDLVPLRLCVRLCCVQHIEEALQSDLGAAFCRWTHSLTPNWDLPWLIWGFQAFWGSLQVIRASITHQAVGHSQRFKVVWETLHSSEGHACPGLLTIGCLCVRRSHRRHALGGPSPATAPGGSAWSSGRTRPGHTRGSGAWTSWPWRCSGSGGIAGSHGQEPSSRAGLRPSRTLQGVKWGET